MSEIDVRMETPGREALTGTTPASIYKPLRDGEQITVAPDGRPMDEQPAWRADFPIDWPQDHYVERRDFMKFLVLTSLAFAVGPFWIAAENWLRRRRGLPEARRVASLGDVAVGAALQFDYPGEDDPCILVRPNERELVAYGQKCTHLSCAVRPFVDRGLLECPCHEGVFDLASGRPLAGPPRRPLPLVRLQVRAGEIYATGVEERTI
ncbi:MAG TPA: Rieske 2Fe-2S domain-containing protein [Vicinamibacterales bacterium]|jgi:nitrite reductase/ring-hydroxylating ferredoxin subunit